MSWGIEFTADIYLSRKNFHENISEVDEEIEELRKMIQKTREQMLMLTAGGRTMVSCKDVESNEVDAVYALHRKFIELLDLYDEYQGELSDLYRYRTFLAERKEKPSNT